MKTKIPTKQNPATHVIPYLIKATTKILFEAKKFKTAICMHGKMTRFYDETKITCERYHVGLLRIFTISIRTFAILSHQKLLIYASTFD